MASGRAGPAFEQQAVQNSNGRNGGDQSGRASDCLRKLAAGGGASSGQPRNHRNLQTTQAQSHPAWRRISIAIAYLLVAGSGLPLIGSAAHGEDANGAYSTPASSATGFRYHVAQDPFTGAYVDFVRVEDQAGPSLMIGKPDKTKRDLTGNVTFVMQPNKYICSRRGNWTLVDFISQADNMLVPHGQYRWEVSRNNRSLYVEPGVISDALLKALTGAKQLRFRFSDDCGEATTLIFDAMGLEAELSKLAVGL